MVTSRIQLTGVFVCQLDEAVGDVSSSVEANHFGLHVPAGSLKQTTHRCDTEFRKPALTAGPTGDTTGTGVHQPLTPTVGIQVNTCNDDHVEKDLQPHRLLTRY